MGLSGRSWHDARTVASAVSTRVAHASGSGRTLQAPTFVAETGIEDNARPAWLRYMGHEARTAIRHGVPLHGLCLYPIVNHPGWDDDRHCYNGLWDYADASGALEFTRHWPELENQRQLMAGRNCARRTGRSRCDAPRRRLSLDGDSHGPRRHPAQTVTASARAACRPLPHDSVKKTAHVVAELPQPCSLSRSCSPRWSCGHW